MATGWSGSERAVESQRKKGGLAVTLEQRMAVARRLVANGNAAEERRA